MSKKRIGHLGLFACCLQLQCLLAQAPFMRQIGEKEGLPSQVIYEIKQDMQGFIWLGTDVGIFRYDGYVFKNYPVPHSQGVAFSDFKEDKQGRIFLLTLVGSYFREQTRNNIPQSNTKLLLKGTGSL